MSFGNNLKALRESKGVSIEELSERTHVSSQIIEDFEAGVFSRISAAIYGSGFVKILATHLGVDPTPLREEFKLEYQAWVEAKALDIKPKAPPQKFVEKRIPEKPAVVAPKPIVAPKPATPPKKPVEPKEPVREEPVVTSVDSEEQGLGDLFDPPKAKVAPEPSPVNAPVFEDKPPRRSFSEVMTSLSQKVGGEKPARQAEPALFHDNLSKRKSIDFNEIKERIVDVLSMINPKIAIIAVAAILIICGLCLLLSGGNSSAEANKVEVPVAASTEAAPATPVSFSGSALTDNLLPPPDCYAE